jgi:hypothetical protein
MWLTASGTGMHAAAWLLLVRSAGDLQQAAAVRHASCILLQGDAARICSLCSGNALVTGPCGEPVVQGGCPLPIRRNALAAVTVSGFN